jgi:hypothetical protein
MHIELNIRLSISAKQNELASGLHSLNFGNFGQATQEAWKSLKVPPKNYSKDVANISDLV